MLSSSWKLMSSENSGKSLTTVVSLPAGQEGHCHTEVKKQGKRDNLSGFFSNNCSTYLLHFLRTNIWTNIFVYTCPNQDRLLIVKHFKEVLTAQSIIIELLLSKQQISLFMTQDVGSWWQFSYEQVHWCHWFQRRDWSPVNRKQWHRKLNMIRKKNKKSKTKPKTKKCLSFNSTSGVHSWTTEGG